MLLTFDYCTFDLEYFLPSFLLSFKNVYKYIWKTLYIYIVHVCVFFSNKVIL